MKKFAFVFTLFCSLLSFAQPDIRAIYAQALDAHKAKEYVTFSKLFQQLDSLNPEHPTITYNLGAGYARTGHTDLALKYARKALHMNATLEPENDEDFASLDSTQIGTLTKTKQELLASVRTGKVLFTNTEKDLHPESVALDPASGDYFLNSVRKGKILRYHPETNTFTEFTSGHWAIMGMRVQNDVLWACEVATTEHEGYDKTNEGKSALLQFDLTSGKVLSRHEMSGGHWFGDVLTSKSGHVYVSDSRQPIIYWLVNGQLEIFQDYTDRLYNLQGLALSSDEKRLYIADYKVGIHVLDMQTKTLTKLMHNDDVITKGTDGLYFFKNSLIAIQNGVQPCRVTRLFLDKTGKFVEQHAYLDKSIPELSEPTLGVLVKNSIVYVANSPWGAYTNGEFSSDLLSDNLIIKADLQ